MARSAGSNKCSHLDNVVQLSLSELCKLKKGEPCTDCDASGPNLWICLQKSCLHIGCSEQYNDHSTTHFQANRLHCIHMNLSSQRIWCYLCEFEVFLPQQQPLLLHRRSSIVSNDSSDTSRYSSTNIDKLIMYGDKLASGAGDSCDSSGEEDDFEKHGRWNGLVGLQNLANTCYMNAALQALSNSPPLTGYFLDCGAVIETDLLGGNANVSKPSLAKHYHKLIREMWCKNRRYVIPNGILYGIRIVHPMFRGYQQHDTQEFLRCFMDQLHEELKETTTPPPDVLSLQGEKDDSHHDDRSLCSSPSPSQSEAEYETCDSGVSERSSLSDEVSINNKRTRKLSRSPSPSINQRNSSSSVRQQSPAGSHRSNSSSNGSMASMQQQQQNQSGGSGGRQQQKPHHSSANEKPPQRSIISDIFDGKLLSSVQCLTCDRISTREETFQDLSLPIPGKDHLAVLHQSQGMSSGGSSTHLSSVSSVNSATSGSSGSTCSDAVYPVNGDSWLAWLWSLPLWSWIRSWFWGPVVTLHDCMAAFFSADELKGDNMYSCEKCNKLRNGVKFSRVLALPEMLCVHLKRFRHDLSYSSKISSPVHFPLYGLDMRPYLHKDCKSEVTSYDLCAVICHHGTVGGGHYTSFAKHDPTGKWFEFDDQLVTQVTPEYVQNCEAYVLFYRKNNTKMASIRAQAINIRAMQEQASDIRFYVSRNWLHRFNTFAEPGPIDNWTLLCPHGAFPPNKAQHWAKLVVPFSQVLWEFLYKKFGGGPVCNHISSCHICKKAAESLSRRQRSELEAFTTCNDEYQYNDTPTTIYAISMAWFREWQMFARGLTTEEPGPINNKIISIPGDTNVPLRNVRQGSDYAQINAALWHFFHGIYGGGPEIVLRGNPVPAPQPQQKVMRDRNSESMDTGIEDVPVSRTSSSTTSVTKEKDTDGVEGMVVNHAPAAYVPTVLTTTSQKPQKSVSFEDNEGYNDNDTSVDGSSTGGDGVVNSVEGNRLASSKRVQMKILKKQHQPQEQQQHQYTRKTDSENANGADTATVFKRKQQTVKQPAAPTTALNGTTSVVDFLEIGSRKDRRHRIAMMKTNGFFGPEGKYQSSSQDTGGGIPRTESFSQAENRTTYNSNMNSSSSVPSFSRSMDDTVAGVVNHNHPQDYAMTDPSSPKVFVVDEMVPLLASPVANNHHGHTGTAEEGEEDAGDESDSLGSKERQGGKVNHQHHGRRGHRHSTDASGDRADKTAGITFGRKKLKSKYMKKLAARAGSITGHHQNGDSVTGHPLAATVNGNASEGEK